MKTSAKENIGGIGRTLLALWLLLFPLAAAVSAGVQKAPAGARAPALAPAAPAPPLRANAPAPGGVWGENRVRGSEAFFVRTRWGELLVIPDPRRGCVWVVGRTASGRVDLYIYPGNNPVNSTDPSGMISPKEAARLQALSSMYGRLGASNMASLLDSLLKLEQRKDATKDPAMVSFLWKNILQFRDRVAAERASVIRGWVAEDAELLGTYYRNTAHDINVLLDNPGSGTQLERKIWEFETALADDSTERVLAIQEAQWRSAIAAFAIHISAMANSALGLQKPTEIPGAEPPAGVSSFKPPARSLTSGEKADLLAKSGADFEVALGQGYKTFGDLKTALGPAGPGQAWHHVVEQTSGNIARFGEEAIHNTANIVRVPHGAGSVHAGISAFYSSAQPGITGSTTMTVRQWLSTRSFAEQSRFGKMVLDVFTQGIK